MFALRASLDFFQAMANGKFNGLMIADFKMQKRVMLDRAPMATIKCIAADKVNRSGNRLVVSIGKNQQNFVGHGRAEGGIKIAIEIRPAPFARTCIHVKFKKRIPNIFG